MSAEPPRGEESEIDLRLVEALVETLVEIQGFDRIPRLGFLQRGISDAESVCEHSWHVAFLVARLGRAVPELDRLRAIELALEHDLAELRTGDLPRPVAHHLPSGAKESMERAVLDDLLAPLEQLEQLARRDREARRAGAEERERLFVKACDRLQLALKAEAYRRAGWSGAEELLRAILHGGEQPASCASATDLTDAPAAEDPPGPQDPPGPSRQQPSERFPVVERLLASLGRGLREGR